MILIFPIIHRCGAEYGGTLSLSELSKLHSYTGHLYNVEVWLNGECIDAHAGVSLYNSEAHFPPPCQP